MQQVRAEGYPVEEHQIKTRCEPLGGDRRNTFYITRAGQRTPKATRTRPDRAGHIMEDGTKEPVMLSRYCSLANRVSERVPKRYQYSNARYPLARRFCLDLLDKCHLSARVPAGAVQPAGATNSPRSSNCVLRRAQCRIESSYLSGA